MADEKTIGAAIANWVRWSWDGDLPMPHWYAPPSWAMYYKPSEQFDDDSERARPKHIDANQAEMIQRRCYSILLPVAKKIVQAEYPQWRLYIDDKMGGVFSREMARRAINRDLASQNISNSITRLDYEHAIKTFRYLVGEVV